MRQAVYITPPAKSWFYPWVLTLTCVLTHIPMIPSLLFVYRRHFLFEAFCGACLLVCSITYHVTEAFDTSFFMDAGRWHKLDNVFAISSVAGTCVHLACIDNRVWRTKLLYGGFFIIMVLQEANPWNETYTFIPIACSVAFAIVSHLFNSQKRKRIILRRIAYGLLSLGAAGFFFVLGLDDANDPGRVFHGIFHVFVGVATYFLWASLAATPEYRIETAAPGEPQPRSKKYEEADSSSIAAVHFSSVVV